MPGNGASASEESIHVDSEERPGVHISSLDAVNRMKGMCGVTDHMNEYRGLTEQEERRDTNPDG